MTKPLVPLLGVFLATASPAAAVHHKPVCVGNVADAQAALLQGMQQRDSVAIRRAMERVACHMVRMPPEKPERYIAVTVSRDPVTADQRLGAIQTLWASAAPRLWWKTGAPPEALRIAAEVIQASLASARMDKRGAAGHIARARAAGDYLLQVQSLGGTGVFGFPMNPRPESEAARLVAGFAKEAARRGLLAQAVHNGWIVDDFGGGDLNYDNGLAGQALLALYKATTEQKYLAAAERSAHWAMTRPLVRNFNYNGFTVALLADLYRVTGRRDFIDEAVIRSDLGVLSGQNKGIDDGSWADPHNKRIVYRYVMIAQLADLLSALPAGHEARERVADALRGAVASVEAQQRKAGGIGNTNAAMVAYCKLKQLGAPFSARSDIADQMMAYAGQAIRAQGVKWASPVATTCFLEHFS